MALTVRSRDDILITIPIHSDMSDNRTAVPTNSKVFRLFKLTAKSFPCVVKAQTISEEIVVPTTIAASIESWIRVLNTTDDMHINDVNVTKLKCTDINEYNIFRCTS